MHKHITKLFDQLNLLPKNISSLIIPKKIIEIKVELGNIFFSDKASTIIINRKGKQTVYA